MRLNNKRSKKDVIPRESGESIEPLARRGKGIPRSGRGMTMLFIVFLMNPAAARAQPDSSTLCRLLHAHQPDESVAYRPGIDVHGKPVVPADLNAPVMLPDKITIPVTVDVAQQLSQALPAGMELDAQFGIIDVYADGRVVYNDRDLTAAAAVACEADAPPQQLVEPAPVRVPPEQIPASKPEPKEEIIWGEGH